jgi:hypothetical protein
MIDIRSSEEFLAFCASPATGHELLIHCPRIELPPTGVILTVNNVTIKPASGVHHVIFTGGRLTLLDCYDIRIERVGFRMQRLTKIPKGLNQTYERSWKGLAILATYGPAFCKSQRITFVNCSFSGHTDEIEIAPLDREWWFANQPGVAAVQAVLFDQCVFGPSFTNTGATITDPAKRAAFQKEREFHNFGMSATCVSGLVMRRCLAVGSNRRALVQIAGDATIEQCIVDNWGTMAIAAHAGSKLSVNACKFIRGPRTSRPPISMVVGTEESAFGKLGKATVAISGNCTEYASNFGASKKGWNLWLPSDGWQKGKVAGSVLNLEPMKDTLANIGCGDKLDVAIRNSLNSLKHVPWMSDYSAAWPG